jgi:hypothetical protein
MHIAPDSAVMSLQARALDNVRAVLAQTRAQPSTPEAQADVILQLSTAAQQLISH